MVRGASKWALARSSLWSTLPPWVTAWGCCTSSTWADHTWVQGSRGSGGMLYLLCSGALDRILYFTAFQILCIRLYRKEERKPCSFFFFFFNLFMAVLGLRFCARAFSSCGKRGPLFITVRGPLTIAASLVAEHRLQTCRLSNCGSRAQLLRGMWDLPSPGLEPASPALAGGLSTTSSPGKPCPVVLIRVLRRLVWVCIWSRVDGHTCRACKGTQEVATRTDLAF